MIIVNIFSPSRVNEMWIYLYILNHKAIIFVLLFKADLPQDIFLHSKEIKYILPHIMLLYEDQKKH